MQYCGSAVSNNHYAHHNATINILHKMRRTITEMSIWSKQCTNAFWEPKVSQLVAFVDTSLQ